jgi:hypothetical protein
MDSLSGKQDVFFTAFKSCQDSHASIHVTGPHGRVYLFVKKTPITGSRRVVLVLMITKSPIVRSDSRLAICWITSRLTRFLRLTV